MDWRLTGLLLQQVFNMILSAIQGIFWMKGIEMKLIFLTLNQSPMTGHMKITLIHLYLPLV